MRLRHEAKVWLVSSPVLVIGWWVGVSLMAAGLDGRLTAGRFVVGYGGAIVAVVTSVFALWVVCYTVEYAWKRNSTNPWARFSRWLANDDE
jgi:hypothetical protein